MTRAAASSMARGRPSSRRQISATATAFSDVSAKSGWTASARATKSRTASDVATSSTPRCRSSSARPSGAIGTSRSPESRRRTRLVTSTVTSGQAPSRSATSGAASIDLLEVVEHQQETLVAQHGLQPLDQGLVARFPHAERRDDGGRHQTRVADRGERDDGDAVGEVLRHRRRRTQREPGLAHPARTGQGQQTERPHAAAGRARAANSRSRPMSGVRGSGSWVGL